LVVIAPGLSEAELRTALYLASIQDPEHHTARASSRQIAEATRVSRSNIQRALDGLARRSLIATRQGSATAAAAYLLNWTQTTGFPGGLTAGPPPQLKLPGVASQQGHPSARAEIDIDPISDSILDRVLTARPQHFQASELTTVRSYAYKWLLLQRGQENAQAPDEQLCAQIAAAAGSVNAAVNFIYDHMADRQAETAAYLVTWILQKLHGIAPAVLRRRRAELRLVGTADNPAPPSSADPAPAAADRQFAAHLVAQAVHGAKTFR
jgi:hypothetical protein